MRSDMASTTVSEFNCDKKVSTIGAMWVLITWLKTVTENLSNMDNFNGPLFCPDLFRSWTQQGESKSKGAWGPFIYYVNIYWLCI